MIATTAVMIWSADNPHAAYSYPLRPGGQGE